MAITWSKTNLILKAEDFELFCVYELEGGPGLLFKRPVVNASCRGETARLVREGRFLQKHSHPHLFKPLQLFQCHDQTGWLAEAAGFAPMNLNQVPSNLSWLVLWETGRRLLLALRYLHRHGCILGGLKPEWLMLHPVSWQIKLHHLGFMIPQRNTFECAHAPVLLAQSDPFLPPEISGELTEYIGAASDLYGFAAILSGLIHAMLQGQTSSPLTHIGSRPHEWLEHWFNQIPQPMLQILTRCLHFQPRERFHHCDEVMNRWGRLQFELFKRNRLHKSPPPEKSYHRSSPPPEFPHESMKMTLDETQFQHLIQKVEAFAPEQGRMILIRASSGMGKTTLLRRLEPVIARRCPHYGLSTCEINRNRLPWFALRRALKQVLEKMLAQQHDSLRQLRQSWQKALGVNARLLTDWIPLALQILGHTEAVLPLPEPEHSHRHQSMLMTTLRLLCDYKPLVLVFDNLQWMDWGTLLLLERWYRENPASSLTVIAAYGRTPLESSSELFERVRQWQVSLPKVDLIQLPPWNLKQTTQWCATTFKRSETQCLPLAGVLTQQSLGSPFRLKQTLKLAANQGAIWYNPDQRSWQWDLRQIKTLPIPLNEPDTLQNAFRQLDASIQELLSCGSCLGRSFPVATLAGLLGLSFQTLIQSCMKAAQHGWVFLNFSEPHAINLIHLEHDSPFQPNALPTIRVRFQHSLFWETAWKNTSSEQKAAWFNKMNLQPEELDEELSVQHPAFIRAILASQLTPDRMAEQERLQWFTRQSEAAQAAQQLADHGTALAYLNEALQAPRHLTTTLDGQPEETPASFSVLLRQLHAQALISCWLLKRHAQTEQHYQQLCTLTDAEAPIHPALIAYLKSLLEQERFEAALKAGVAMLKSQGISFPERFTKAMLSLEFTWIRFKMNSLTYEKLCQPPYITDETLLHQVEVMILCAQAAFHQQPELYTWLVLRLNQIILKHGLSRFSAEAMAHFGVVAASSGETQLGAKTGKLATQLTSFFQAPEFDASVFALHHGWLQHWENPMQGALEGLSRGCELGQAHGNYHSALLCQAHLCRVYWLLGYPLPEVQKHLDAVLEQAQGLQISAWLQEVQSLKGLVTRLSQPYAPPEQLQLANATQEHRLKNEIGVFMHEWYCCLWCLHTGQVETALRHLNQAQPHLECVRVRPEYVHFHLMQTLLLVSILPANRRKPSSEVLKTVKENLKFLKKVAKQSALNYRVHAYLCEAEWLRVNNKIAQASEKYDQAIKNAERTNQLAEECLACEAAVRFYQQIGKESIAVHYATQTLKTCQRWGAVSKYNYLLKQFSQIYLLTLPQDGVEGFLA